LKHELTPAFAPAAALAASMMENPGSGGGFGGGGGTDFDTPMETSSAAVLESLEKVQVAMGGACDELFEQLKDMYNGKKWHQLTVVLEKCFAMSVWQSSPTNQTNLVMFYNSFVSEFWSKLNRKRMANFMIMTANCIGDSEGRFDFLKDCSQKLLSERTPDDEAVLVLRCEMSGIILGRGDAKECKVMVEECETKLVELTGCENRTYATVYNASAAYHKAAGDADAYYKSALLYLGYVNIEEVAIEEQRRIAFEIGKAGLDEGLLQISLPHSVLYGKSIQEQRSAATNDIAPSSARRPRCSRRRLSTSASC
jgi:hypothetical protein